MPVPTVLLFFHCSQTTKNLDIVCSRLKRLYNSIANPLLYLKTTNSQQEINQRAIGCTFSDKSNRSSHSTQIANS